jgi:soluble lytic murein transglycosylase-like protein
MKIVKLSSVWLCFLLVGFLAGFLLSKSESPVSAKSIVIEENTNNKLIALISDKQPKLDPVVVREIASAVEQYADEYQLPYVFVVSIIDKESSFKPISISSKSCKGLMQVHPKFHQDKITKFGIKGDEIYHIKNNVRLGCAIFREYYDQTGSITKALAKYYGTNDINYNYRILASFADLMIEHQEKGEKDGKVVDRKVEEPSKS